MAVFCRAGAGDLAEGSRPFLRQLRLEVGWERCWIERVKQTTGLDRIDEVTVQGVEVRAMNIPLRAPFGIAGGAQAVAANVLVRVELASGTVGWGEAAPLPAYNGETQGQVLSVFKKMTPRLVGGRWGNLRVAAAALREREKDDGGSCGAAQCAWEMALLDAVTRERGEALWSFFGGAEATLETDMTVTTGTVDEGRAAAEAIGRLGIRVIKVKVGGPGGGARDRARMRAIREVAPNAPLIVDGNASLSRGEATELAAGLKADGIVPAVVEQWLAKDDLVGARDFRAATGWCVAADESVVGPLDVMRLAHAGAADVVNIKLMKAGVVAGWDVVRVARTVGLGLMIGGNVESMLAMTFSACFAAGIGGFRHADLDTPLFMAENPLVGGYEREGGILRVDGLGPGHGVVPCSEMR